MHVYSSESRDRRVVPFVLAAASIGIVVLLRSLVAKLGYTSEINVSLLSSFTIYGVLYFVFDRHAWKWGLVRLLAGSAVPDLEGRWSGVLRSSHSGLAKEHKVDVEIVQTWSQIKIFLESPTSRSESQMAVIKASAPDRHELVWEYMADSTAAGQDESFPHFGVTRLVFQLGSVPPRAIGWYYTEPKRDTYGNIELSKRENDG